MNLATKLAETCLRVKKASLEYPGTSIVSGEGTGIPQVTPESMRDTFEESMQEEKILRNSADRYMRLANRRAMDNEQGPGGAFFSRLLPVPWSAGEAAWRIPIMAALGIKGNQLGTELGKHLMSGDPDTVNKMFLPGDGGSQISLALAQRLKAEGKDTLKYPKRHIDLALAGTPGKLHPLVERLLNTDPQAAALSPETLQELEKGKDLQTSLEGAENKLSEQRALRSKNIEQLRKEFDRLNKINSPPIDVGTFNTDATPYPGPSAVPPGVAPLSDEDFLDMARRHENPDKFITKPLGEVAATENAIRSNEVLSANAQKALQEFNTKYGPQLAQHGYRKQMTDELSTLLSAYSRAASGEGTVPGTNPPLNFEGFVNSSEGMAVPAHPGMATDTATLKARQEHHGALLLRELRNAAKEQVADNPKHLEEFGPHGKALQGLLSDLSLQDREDLAAVINSKNVMLPDKAKRDLRRLVAQRLEAAGLPANTLERGYESLIESGEKGWKPSTRWSAGLGTAGGVMLGGALSGLPMAIRAAHLNRTGGELAQNARTRSRKAMERADKEQFRRENIVRALEGQDTLPRSELRDNIRTKRQTWRKALRDSGKLSRMSGGDSQRMLEAFQNAGSGKQGALDTIRRILD
jgi:hypothetical protein